MFLFRRKNKYPEIAKYKKGDFVNFRYRNTYSYSFIIKAFLKEHKFLYTIQLWGQCPSFIY